MELFADLHLHSRFSRATSQDLTLENLERWARIKGLGLLGTGDFTHPQWFSELRQLEEENGILLSRTGFPFLLTVEVSNVFQAGGKQRRIHSIILAPGLEVAERIREWLGKRGRLDYDGRPTFGFSCKELLEGLLEIDPWIELIPAHAWTPWYGIFGSKSGFDSLEECFGELSGHIHALETGLSSDPEMNWRLSALDRLSLVSFSDSHSYWPWRLGRECTVFSCKPDYRAVVRAIRQKEILYTIEVDPAYGKYHWDGHRECGVWVKPETAEKLRGVCPVCKRPLTIGVLHRVSELADRPDGFRPDGAKPFYSLLPLSEILSRVLKSNVNSQTVWDMYNKLIQGFGNEFQVLLKAEEEEIEKIAGKEIAGLILANRERRIRIQPGFDGVYGKIIEGEPKENLPESGVQKGLSDFLKSPQP